jgi:ferritin-like metal-binding protein YciE
MKTAQSTAWARVAVEDEFETALVVELEQLHKRERVLQKMYPRLKSKPQLRDRFLQELAEMQQCADRLDAVLNPIGALQYMQAPATAPSIPVA